MSNVETVGEFPSPRDHIARWTSIDMFDAGAFALGACCAIRFQATGRLYLGELLLGAMAFVLVLRWIMRPVRLDSLVVKFCACVFVSGLGYLLSDLYRGTPLTDVIRGMGKWTILTTCIISLSWIGLNDFRRFCILVTGWALAFCVFLRLLDDSLQDMIQMNPWKFIYAFPVTLVLAYLANGKRWLTLLIFAGVTVLSTILDARAFSLISMATAACVVVCSFRRKQNVVLIAVVLICGAGGALIASNAASKYDYSERQNTSAYWRMASLNMGIEAIKRSPFIGYGTWARQIELAEVGNQMFEEYTGQQAFRFSSQVDYIEAHSQLLESWIQGGILGVTFFLFLGFYIVATLRYLLFERRYRPDCPFLVFLLVHGLWNLLLSPFGDYQRLMIAFSVVAICWLRREALDWNE